MATQIIVDETYCKGCGLCVDVCPESIMELDTNKLTAKGYHPAVLVDPSKCKTCLQCAQMCPDVAITIVKE